MATRPLRSPDLGAQHLSNSICKHKQPAPNANSWGEGACPALEMSEREGSGGWRTGQKWDFKVLLGERVLGGAAELRGGGVCGGRPSGRPNA